jgi:hypothetical protein
MSEFEDEEDIYEDDFYENLTDEQIEIVDNWWDRYYELDKADEIVEHLNTFLLNQRDLVPYLELYEEPLHTLAETYLQENNFEKYIQFIRQLKKTHPQEVISGGGQIELNILTWLLAKDRTEDIPEFLQPFQELPLQYASVLPQVIDIFLLLNKAEFIIPILLNVYQLICENEDFTNPYATVHPIIADYIDRHYHNVSAGGMISFLTKQLNVALDEDVLEESFWEVYFKSVKRPFEIWPDTKPDDQLEVVELCRMICENFMRFLKERLGLHFASAEHLAFKVDQYLLEFLDRNRSAKKIFNFSYGRMRKAIESVAGGHIWLDFVQLMLILNGLYYFVDYLQECGNLSPVQVLKIKSDLGKIHNSYIEDGLENELDTMLFEDFPIIY